jgi:hypothetical protein
MEIMFSSSQRIAVDHVGLSQSTLKQPEILNADNTHASQERYVWTVIQIQYILHQEGN